MPELNNIENHFMSKTVMTYLPITLVVILVFCGGFNLVNGQQSQYPSLTLDPPVYDGLKVTIDGHTEPGVQDASISYITWDWGDGQSTTGSFPQSHTYRGGGTFTVKVTSYDNFGNGRWETSNVTIASLVSSSSYPSIGATGLSLDKQQYTAGDTIKADIVLGAVADGNPPVQIDVYNADKILCLETQVTPNPTDAAATFRFNEAVLGADGVYTVTTTYQGVQFNQGSQSFTLTNGTPSTTSRCSNTVNSNPTPTPSPNPTPLWPSVTLSSPSYSGLTITIDGLTEPRTQGASITNITWDWGDGQSSSGSFPQYHTYLNSGTYTVKVTSYDSFGNYGWAKEDVSVSVPAQSEQSIQSSIPTWIHENAGYWATGQMDDQTFVTGIQWLIKQGIITIPTSTTSSGSGSHVIPTWIKNNAGYWATGQMDDQTFVTGIQWLITNGIIVPN